MVRKFDVSELVSTFIKKKKSCNLGNLIIYATIPNDVGYSLI